MKKIPVLLACLATLSSASAQLYIGLAGGPNKNYLVTDVSNRPFTGYKSQAGFSIGIPVQYRFNSWLGAQAELVYIQKNYKLARSGYYTGAYEKSVNSYLQVPLMARFSFGTEKIRGFLNLGGYVGYWAGARRKGTLPNMEDVVENPAKVNTIFDIYRPYHYNEKYPFSDVKDRRWELGGLAGAGIEYLLKPRYLVFLEGRYYVAVTDQQKSYMINRISRYNETFGLQAGFMVTLHK